MTSSNHPYPQLLVFRGQTIDARYHPAQLPIYRDNPLIEALPPLLTQEAAFLALQYLPPPIWRRTAACPLTSDSI